MCGLFWGNVPRANGEEYVLEFGVVVGPYVHLIKLGCFLFKGYVFLTISSSD